MQFSFTSDGKVAIINPKHEASTTTTRGIFDTGSQRTYITCRLHDELDLCTLKTESLSIKTFGSTESQSVSCDVVQLELVTRNKEMILIMALVVPCISNSLTTQPISYAQEHFDHLLDQT